MFVHQTSQASPSHLIGGVLRGLQDPRTPLAVAGVGAVVNAALNVWFVHGLHLGVGGSALGTSLTQLGMAAVTVAVVVAANLIARVERSRRIAAVESESRQVAENLELQQQALQAEMAVQQERAHLAEVGSVPDPNAFATALVDLMARAL